VNGKAPDANEDARRQQGKPEDLRGDKQASLKENHTIKLIENTYGERR
jgi:hypothetical protein